MTRFVSPTFGKEPRADKLQQLGVDLIPGSGSYFEAKAGSSFGAMYENFLDGYEIEGYTEDRIQAYKDKRQEMSDEFERESGGLVKEINDIEYKYNCEENKKSAKAKSFKKQLYRLQKEANKMKSAMNDKARKFRKDATLEKFITSRERTLKYKREFEISHDDEEDNIIAEYNTDWFYDCQLTPKDPSPVFKIDKDGKNHSPQF